MRRVKPDPAGAVLGAVLAIAGVFNVAAQLDITADELAIVAGGLFTIAASIRAWVNRERAE